MEMKLWHNSYPTGVAHEINPDKYESLPAFLADCFQKYAHLPAYINLDTTLTFAEVDVLSTHFASYLQNVLHLKKGDRIAIQMPNLLQYPIVMFGALKAGLIVVNTNPLYTEREMEHQFNDSGATAIVILANFADKLQNILAKTSIKHVIVTQIGDMCSFFKRIIVNAVVKYVKKMVPSYHLPSAIDFKSTLQQGAQQSFNNVAIKNSDTAFLQYTGGTTGLSKGAMLSHRNILANLEQNGEWMKVLLKEGEETVVTALPLYHIFSLTVNCFTMAKIGAKNILVTNPRDMKSFISDLKKYRISIFTGVNTLYNGLMNQPNIREVNFSSLKVAIGGGMAVQSAVAARWKSITGVALREGYGLTETSPVLCCNPLVGEEKIGTIGLPFPSTDIKIMDDNGVEVPVGDRGEICAKGPQVMSGYWQQPEETAHVFYPDGWFKTGDIGIQEPDGYIRIVDRKKDMILVSGFNVYPNEVEDTIMKNAKVLEAACIGVKDDKTGEAVKLFIVKKDSTLTEQEVKDFCKKELTAYKQPKYVEFRTELPKTNVGKILRRMLKEEAKS
jgi:long-chain acyl-CoA synthetase